jgi:hypothetical protein
VTGINVVAGKQALVAALADTLPDCTVGYSYVGKLHAGARDYVYLGNSTEAEVALAAYRNETSGRYRRQEEAPVEVCVNITRKGESTAEAGEVRAAEVGALIENYIASNPTLGVPGLLIAKIVGFKLNSTADDDGTYTNLDYSVLFQSDLT